MLCHLFLITFTSQICIGGSRKTLNRVGGITILTFAIMKKKFKKLAALEVSKVKKEKLNAIKGGVCTCGSRSVCHIDGSDEGDVN